MRANLFWLSDKQWRRIDDREHDEWRKGQQQRHRSPVSPRLVIARRRWRSAVPSEPKQYCISSMSTGWCGRPWQSE